MREEVILDEHWLEDSNSHATRVWLKEQRSLLLSALVQGRDRTTLSTLIDQLLAIPSMDAPFVAADQRVFCFRAASEPLANAYWKSGANSKISTLASSQERRSASVIHISPDGKRVALAWREDGRDEVEIQIVELETGSVLAEQLPQFHLHRTTWDRDLHGYFFFCFDGLRNKLCFQPIPTNDDVNPTIIQDALPVGEISDMSLAHFQDSQWLVLVIRKSRIPRAFDYYLLSREPGSPILPLWIDCPHFAAFSAKADQLYVLTDQDAPYKRVLRINVSGHKIATPVVVIPESSFPYTSMTLAGEMILLTVGASPWTTEVQAFSQNGETIPLAGLPDECTIENVRGSSTETLAYVEAGNIGHLPTIYSLDTKNGMAQLYFQPYSRWKQPEIETIKTHYTSEDGTTIPIRISRRKDLEFQRPGPVMLTTYGGFGVIDAMRFTNRSALWLSLGGVYVHAGVRGGGEFGEDWHRAGMLHNKENVFRDFLSAAEWLVATRYTTPDLLAIVGGSNAGLVVGVAMTQRPDVSVRPQPH